MIANYEANRWKAAVLITDEENSFLGWKHIEARITGDELVDAKEGAHWILDHFAMGREVAIRVPPEGETYQDFDSKLFVHRGYVRFSYKAVGCA